MKTFYSTTGDKGFILLLLPIIIVGLGLLFAASQVQVKITTVTKTTQPLKPNTIELLKEKVNHLPTIKPFDYQAVLNHIDKIYTNQDMGISLKYPSQTWFFQPPKKDLADYYFNYWLGNPLGAVTLTLTSQPKDSQTELFDGFNITIYHQTNPQNYSLQKIPQLIETKLKSSGITILESKPININGIPIWKIEHQNLRDHYTDYYFLNKKEELIKISLFIVGPNLSNWQEIADKIINSLELN